MKAVKGNKEYTINESQKKFYQESGFDIFDENGEVVAYGRGKTVPYDDHMRAVEEIERLQVKVAELQASGGEPADSQEVIGILTSYASEHQIDLGRVTTTEGILKKIKEHKPEGGA